MVGLQRPFLPEWQHSQPSKVADLLLRSVDSLAQLIPHAPKLPRSSGIAERDGDLLRVLDQTIRVARLQHQRGVPEVADRVAQLRDASEGTMVHPRIPAGEAIPSDAPERPQAALVDLAAG